MFNEEVLAQLIELNDHISISDIENKRFRSDLLEKMDKIHTLLISIVSDAREATDRLRSLEDIANSIDNGLNPSIPDDD